MKILVTGGAGFIGSHLTRALLDKGHKVSVVDSFQNFAGYDFFENFDYRKNLIKGAKLYRTKASDPSVWKEKYEVVAHLAALPVIIPKRGDFYKINIQETEKVLRLARKNGVRRFLFMSSIYAQGNYPGHPYEEDMPLDPIDLYGTSKAVGEFLTRFFFGDREWVAIRTAGVFGFGDHNNRVFQLIVEKYQRLPQLFLSKNTSRIFVYIDDLVEGIVRATELKVSHEVFNIASGVVTLEDFAKEVKKYFPKLTWKLREQSKGEIIVGPASIEKAKKILGYQPKYTLRRAVKEYVRKVKRYRDTRFKEPKEK